MKVHELLTGKNWLQSQTVCDKNGDSLIQPNDPRACGWCVVAAVEKCYPKPEPVLLLLARQITLVVGSRDPCDIVCDWNDTSTWEEVRGLLVKLDL